MHARIGRSSFGTGTCEPHPLRNRCVSSPHETRDLPAAALISSPRGVLRYRSVRRNPASSGLLGMGRVDPRAADVEDVEPAPADADRRWVIVTITTASFVDLLAPAPRSGQSSYNYCAGNASPPETGAGFDHRTFVSPRSAHQTGAADMRASISRRSRGCRWQKFCPSLLPRTERLHSDNRSAMHGPVERSLDAIRDLPLGPCDGRRVRDSSCRQDLSVIADTSSANDGCPRTQATQSLSSSTPNSALRRSVPQKRLASTNHRPRRRPPSTGPSISLP